jgi:hypothetical protein
MWLNGQTDFPSDVIPLFLNTHSQPQFKGARAQCYKTFYSFNIPVFIKSKSVCPSQTFSAECYVFG